MSTVQPAPSPRPPRNQQQMQGTNHSQGAPRKQTQRKPRGNRAHNNVHQRNGVATSPSQQPQSMDNALSGNNLDTAATPRRHRKHAPQHLIDQICSPAGPHTSLTDNEATSMYTLATPVKLEGAYAGPTFHASPAPSALPIPRFLSKSVPAKTRVGPSTPPPEDNSDSTASPSSSTSPSRAPVHPRSRTEDSPLDLLFNAHKAEKARNTHGSPVSASLLGSPESSRTQHFKQDSFHSLNGVLPAELDGKTRNTQTSPVTRVPLAHRAATDPFQVPQLKDVSSGNSHDVMQDLFNRLSMSQKNMSATTPPKGDGPPSEPQSPHQTPSPFHDGHEVVRSASGPSTPVPASNESPDFFYGNKNLSPLFKAAKGDTPKRNSGLRTEITADSPMVAQNMFSDLPTVPHPGLNDAHVYNRANSRNGNGQADGARQKSAPFTPFHQQQQSPNQRRRTPGRNAHQPRSDSYPSRVNNNVSNHKAGKLVDNGPSIAAKPATTMMSFVPASVSAKPKQQSSAVLVAPGSLASKVSDPPAIEYDLKRLLNFKVTNSAQGGGQA